MFRLLNNTLAQNPNDANFVAILIAAVLILLAIALIAYAFRILGNHNKE